MRFFEIYFWTPLPSGIAYKPFGPAAAMTLGNGITIARTFDKNYQLLSLGAGTVLNRTYTPDNVGNIELITDNLDSSRSQSFTYDDLYRLTDASGVYGTVGFTYDKVGNRQTRIQTGTTSSQDSYAYYPGTNRLKTVTGNHTELLQYDADGNTTQRIPGAGNPQPPITDPANYTYNSAGQRAIKDAASDVVYHYDQSGQLIAETDATGNMLKAYVWLFGQPLAMIASDGAVYYFHNDHLGTPQKMTDSSGAVVWAADYLPFGQADVTIATVENNLRFAGQYYDSETGLHYNHHRYYDPKLGRYLRADPIGLGGGLNPFSFVFANPIRYKDPRGLFVMGHHLEITRTALIATGCTKMELTLPSKTMKVDFEPESQETYNSRWHAMANGDIIESAEQAEIETNKWIDSELSKCSLSGFAHALHAEQDKYSKSHAFKPWYGGGLFGLPSPGHMWEDSFGAIGAPINDATIATIKLIEKIKSICPCACQS
jgi:RHS repeat-associated protein